MIDYSSSATSSYKEFTDKYYSELEKVKDNQKLDLPIPEILLRKFVSNELKSIFGPYLYNSSPDPYWSHNNAPEIEWVWDHNPEDTNPIWSYERFPKDTIIIIKSRITENNIPYFNANTDKYTFPTAWLFDTHHKPLTCFREQI